MRASGRVLSPVKKNRMWYLLLAISAFVNGAAAQGSVSMVATPVEQTRAFSPKVLLVNPDGSKVSGAGVKLEKQTQWVQSEQSASDFLQKSGIVADVGAVNAFKKLNPQLRPDGTIPAGSKVSVFAPVLNSNLTSERAPKASFDMTTIARLSVNPQVAEARRHRVDTFRLSADSYERPGDLRVHRALALEVDETASLISQRASRMSSMDLALSKFYLASANAKLEGVKSSKAVKISGRSVAEIEAATLPVRSMRTLMMEGGSPFQYRPVVVSVLAKPGEAEPPRYRVYVLPAGIVDSPTSYDDDLLLQLLGDLSFEKLTSPSKYSVAQGEMRVWIGPDYEYRSMAKKIRQRTLVKTTPVHAAADPTSLSITLIAPDDVVMP